MCQHISIVGKKHKKAEAYRSYEEEAIPSPPSRDPIVVNRAEDPPGKLSGMIRPSLFVFSKDAYSAKKPLRPLKPACPPPPRRPSHSPPRQSFEQRVMDFQSNPVRFAAVLLVGMLNRPLLGCFNSALRIGFNI